MDSWIDTHIRSMSAFGSLLGDLAFSIIIINYHMETAQYTRELSRFAEIAALDQAEKHAEICGCSVSDSLEIGIQAANTLLRPEGKQLLRSTCIGVQMLGEAASIKRRAIILGRSAEIGENYIYAVLSAYVASLPIEIDYEECARFGVSLSRLSASLTLDNEIILRGIVETSPDSKRRARRLIAGWEGMSEYFTDDLFLAFDFFDRDGQKVRDVKCWGLHFGSSSSRTFLKQSVQFDYSVLEVVRIGVSIHEQVPEWPLSEDSQ